MKAPALAADTAFWGITGAITSGMVFLFLAKGVVKRSGADLDGLVQATEREQPRLFAFVRRLCAEENTAFPAGSYLTHDVNAAVFYPRSLLRLFLPVRRNLLVGLGLVNNLNLTEFKAVLAHEFGHFAQSSMKLGQYVYVANRIIGDLVYGRDAWDDWLARWRRQDPRIAFPAYAITAVVWALRLLLAALFRVINIANLSLSRQMEFNADLFAVRLTGSDPIVSGLWKTERAAMAFQKAVADLGSMAQHRRYTDDLYWHQTAAFADLDEFLAKHADTPHLQSLRDPYAWGRRIHFKPSDEHASPMWETHPPHRDREENAKRHYVPCTPVETAAWELFADAPRLRRRLTNAAYEALLGIDAARLPRTRAEEMDGLVRAEHEEMKQADHYHGFYEDRAVEPGDIEALAAEIDAGADPAALRAEALPWPGEGLRGFMAEVEQRHGAQQRLQAVAAGQARGDSFDFRGERCRRGEATKLQQRVSAEQEELLRRTKDADRAIFRHFYAASAADPALRHELKERYRFLIEVQTFILQLNAEERSVAGILQILEKNRELNAQQYAHVMETLDDAHRRVQVALHQCGALRLPRLRHMDAEKTVGSFLLREPFVGPLDPSRPDAQWLPTFLGQFQQVLTKLRKLHYKNLGNLLKLQERLDPGLFAPADSTAEAPRAAETAETA